MCINKFKYVVSVFDLNIPSYKHTNKYIIFCLSSVRIILMTVSPRSLSSSKKPFLLYTQTEQVRHTELVHLWQWYLLAVAVDVPKDRLVGAAAEEHSQENTITWYIIFSMVVLRVYVHQDFLNWCISRPTLENFSKLLTKNDRVYEMFILGLKYSPRSAS